MRLAAPRRSIFLPLHSLLCYIYRCLYHVAKRSGVEKLVASPAPSLPPAVPLRIPSPRSNRGGSRGVHVCAHHRTGKTKTADAFFFSGDQNVIPELRPFGDVRFLSSHSCVRLSGQRKPYRSKPYRSKPFPCPGDAQQTLHPGLNPGTRLRCIS